MNLALTPAERVKLTTSGAMVAPPSKHPRAHHAPSNVEVCRKEWREALTRAKDAFDALIRAERAYLVACDEAARKPRPRRVPPLDPYAVPAPRAA